jgi:hypothetical protein
MKYVMFFLSFLFIISCLKAQEGFVVDSDVDDEKNSFEMHSNLIIVPVKVNDLNFNFILDTGVTQIIIFSLKGIDSLY